MRFTARAWCTQKRPDTHVRFAAYRIKSNKTTKHEPQTRATDTAAFSAGCSSQNPRRIADDRLTRDDGESPSQPGDFVFHRLRRNEFAQERWPAATVTRSQNILQREEAKRSGWKEGANESMQQRFRKKRAGSTPNCRDPSCKAHMELLVIVQELKQRRLQNVATILQLGFTWTPAKAIQQRTKDR